MDLVKTSENQSSTPLSSAESKTRRRPPLGLVLILLSTAVLGVIAVVSAFRLYQSKEEPIAPTAPEKTSAQEASSCILRFAVPEPTPTPTPTNTPTLTPTPSPTNTPTPTPTNTPTPEPTPTPVPECWDTCSNHSQCPSGLNCLSGRCANPSCSTEPSCTCPTPTPTPTPTPVYSLQCIEVKMYDYGWNQIFDFTTLRPQDVVHLTVRGETDHPQGLTMARFKINNGAWQETTDIRNGEFHIEYQISSSGEHVIEAQVYNSVFGWK